MSEVENTTVTKTCTQCHEEKVITEFNRHSGVKCGYRPKCRKCLASNANKERLAETNKIWVENNRERYLATKKAWYEKNKEALSAKSKSNYVHTKARYNASSKAWREANPMAVVNYCRNRRALKKNAEGTHTVEDIKNILTLQKSKCAVCKKKVSEGYHVDHVIALSNGGSNDKHNLQILCQSCNISKHNKDPIEFMQSRGNLL